MFIANIVTSNKKDLLFNKTIPEYINIVDYEKNEITPEWREYFAV